MSTDVQTVVKVDSVVVAKPPPSVGGGKSHRDSPVKRPMNFNLSNSAGGGNVKQQQSFSSKFQRKRQQSGSSGGSGPGSKIFPPYKKRKKEALIPPTKFLLGGNIRDPLNLNSLQDEEVNRKMNAVTPESSPLPTPQHRKGEVEVIIPADIHDPLSLAKEEDNDAYAASFNRSTPIKRKGKKKKKRGSGGGPAKVQKDDSTDLKTDGSKTDEQQFEAEPINKSDDLKPADTVVTTNAELQLQKTDFVVPKPPAVKPTVLEVPTKEVDKGGGNAPAPLKPTRKLFDNKDKIVSPVIPQPGAWYVGHHPLRHRKHQHPKPSSQTTPKFKKENQRFQYGNYNQYYGYRNKGESRDDTDPRLKLLSRTSPDLFTDKDVLDVGCNVGAVAVSVAKDYGARKVVGIDIDKSLINRARMDLLKMNVATPSVKKFPVMMAMTYGSLDAPCVSSTCSFPNNVSFVQGNYVLESDILLNLEKPQFDVILCLSVTKWIHLNFGDDGLKRVFARMFAQLRPGGKLVLEPQPWPSYKKRRNLSETTWKHYKSIKLLPTMFNDYLLSEVGFIKCETVGVPFNPSKGFQRPIKIYTKPDEETAVRPPESEEPTRVQTTSEDSDRSQTSQPTFAEDTS